MALNETTEQQMRALVQDENQRTVDANKPSPMQLFGQSGAAAVVAQFGAVGVNFLLFVWLLTYYMPQQQLQFIDRLDKSQNGYQSELSTARLEDAKRTERIWSAIDANTKALSTMTLAQDQILLQLKKMEKP